MRKKKSRKHKRLRWTLKDKLAIAKYQEQIDIFGNIVCKMCGRSFPIDIMEVDHIIPISKGGDNRPSNLQLLCPSCNRKKSAKTKKRKKYVNKESSFFQLTI